MALERSNVSRTRIKKKDCADAFNTAIQFCQTTLVLRFCKGEKVQTCFCFHSCLKMINFDIWIFISISERSWMFCQSTLCYRVSGHAAHPTSHCYLDRAGWKSPPAKSWIESGLKEKKLALPYSLTVTYTNPRGTLGSYKLFLLYLVIL